MTYRLGRGLFGRNVEKDEILAGDDVRDTVTVVGNWTETSTGRNAVRILGQIKFGGLAVRSLRGRQAPRFAEHFLQEGRIHFQVFGDNVQAEQVTIDAFTTHGILIASLMDLTSFT